MALEHALLVSLAERAASGLELTRRFDASIGFFWQASHQQIYRTLKRMETAGWVTSEEVIQDKRPTKLVYEVTPAGHDEVRHWLSEPTAPSPQRSELAVKLRGAWIGDHADDGDHTDDRRTDTVATPEATGPASAPPASAPPASGPRRKLLADVRRHLAEHTARLEHYRQGCARDYPDPQTLSGGDLDRYLVLRGGILQEESQVAWLTEYLAAFTTDPTETAEHDRSETAP